MRRDRLVPLIVAVALFMENLDSTVIATSLPAIAADIGTSPLALKLAVTSYLLSLAVFIPMSGWTADRFGGRTVFRAAIAVFVLGSIGCAASSSLTDFIVARIVQGMGGAMMTPVGRLVMIRSVDKRALIDAMAWVSMPALVGPVMGPPLGGFITTYASWHWIFIINVPMGLLGILLATRYIEDVRVTTQERFDLIGMLLAGAGIGGIAFGLSVAGLHYLPGSIVAGLIVGGACSFAAYLVHARRVAAPRAGLLAAASADLSGKLHRRIPVSRRRRRAAVSAPVIAAARLQARSVPIRADHVLGRCRRADHEGCGGCDSQARRLPLRADRQCGPERRLHRRVRGICARRAVRTDDRGAARRRLLPLS